MALPDKWYVFYRNKEEFDILNTYYSKEWTYFEQTSPAQYCYTNLDGYNNWGGGGAAGLWFGWLFKKQGAIEISFDDFRREVLGENIPSNKSSDLKYLVKLFKKLKIT
ncbi:MAG: hypothetical protein AABY22_19575 [Nanoarchaeota archaeon]